MLTTRPAEIPAWDAMDPKLKPDPHSGEMEVYAGFLEHTDHHVGRLVRHARKACGLLDNHADLLHRRRQRRTRPKVRSNGTFNELFHAQRRLAAFETPEFLAEHESTNSAVRRRTITTQLVGRMRWTRRISGPNR